MAETGRCLCGRVRYEVACAIGPLVNCHCQFCRRAHGAAFITVTWVPKSDLRFTVGAHSVKEFRTEGVGVRAFCEHCGTRLYNQALSNPDFVALVVSSLDAEPDRAPVVHVNVESKAAWYEILDGRPQFAALPPGAEAALESKPR
jgi:hypothetical protein